MLSISSFPRYVFCTHELRCPLTTHLSCQVFNGQAGEGLRQSYTIVPLPDRSNPVTDRVSFSLPLSPHSPSLHVHFSGTTCHPKCNRSGQSYRATVLKLFC